MSAADSWHYADERVAYDLGRRDALIWMSGDVERQPDPEYIRHCTIDCFWEYVRGWHDELPAGLWPLITTLPRPRPAPAPTDADLRYQRATRDADLGDKLIAAAVFVLFPLVCVLIGYLLASQL